MSRDLLAFNERGALSQVLAIEEHLQQLPPGVNNSWCAQKHALLAVDHHLNEAVDHASRINPALAGNYRQLKAEAEEVLKPSAPGVLPRLADVAALRNHMREVFGDPTLRDNCSICSEDKMHPLHPRHPYANGVPAMYGLGATPQAKNPDFWCGLGTASVLFGFGFGAKQVNKTALAIGAASLFYSYKLRNEVAPRPMISTNGTLPTGRGASIQVQAGEGHGGKFQFSY